MPVSVPRRPSTSTPVKGNVPLPDADQPEPRILEFPAGKVRCRQRLGGLLKHYYRAAA